MMATVNGRSWLRGTSSRIGLGWQRAQAEVDMLERYAKGFGLARGPFLRLRYGRGSSETVRLARAALRRADMSATFELRLGTSDISVFNAVFCWNEYAFDFASPPRVIVDAGAYIGLSAAYFAMRYPDAVVIALEPSAANFELLVRNTSAFANVRPIRAALWPRSGSVAMIDPGCDAWGLRVTQSGGESCGQPQGTGRGEAGANPVGETITAVTVADVLEQYGLDRIDLLKMDIEGSEKEVFAAADGWIDRVDAICLELHDRFKPGCSRSFFSAVRDFPIEAWQGEHVLVLREESRLAPVDVPLARS